MKLLRSEGWLWGIVAVFAVGGSIGLAAACGAGGSGGDDDDDDETENADDDDGNVVTSGGNKPGPSQGLSEECDADLGVDACGAGLFCAAFDGRTVTTCYAERSRMEGAECGENIHCVTNYCNDDICATKPPGAMCEENIECSSYCNGGICCCGGGTSSVSGSSSAATTSAGGFTD